MREILFRGKQIDANEWVEGSLLVFPKTKRTKILAWEEADLDFNSLEVDPKTVGQYTGRKDKNGKKIFEGDIVTGLFLWGMSINAVVTFRDGAFGLKWNRGDVETFSAFTSICNVEFEVVGNIHDNSELLKRGQE